MFNGRVNLALSRSRIDRPAGLGSEFFSIFRRCLTSVASLPPHLIRPRRDRFSLVPECRARRMEPRASFHRNSPTDSIMNAEPLNSSVPTEQSSRVTSRKLFGSPVLQDKCKRAIRASMPAAGRRYLQKLFLSPPPVRRSFPSASRST